MGEVFIGARILTGQTSMTFDKQEYQRKWYERNKSMHIARTLSRYTAQRVHLLALLGSECACCGEAETLFLDIDHIELASRLRIALKLVIDADLLLSTGRLSWL